MRSDLYDQMNKQEGYYWWHVGKREIVLEMLEKYVFTNKTKNFLKILDLGCGTGMMMTLLKKNGKIWGFDVNPAALEYCRQKKAGDFLVKANLEKKLPVKDCYFEIVIFLDVLEHIKNEKLILSEIRRVLKNHGVVLITVPAYSKLFSYWDKMSGHYRRYNTAYLRDILKESGFKVEKMTYFNLFALVPAIIFRLFKSHRKLKIEEYNSDFVTLPYLLNSFLLFLARLERDIICLMNLPVGLSIFCLARKETD